MAEERKGHTNLYDLPDKNSTGEPEGERTNIYLRLVCIYHGLNEQGKDELQMKSGYYGILCGKKGGPRSAESLKTRHHGFERGKYKNGGRNKRL